MLRNFLFLGALNGLLTVALGAFGAHALRSNLAADMVAVYDTASNYHGHHALALLAVGLLLIHRPDSRWLQRAGWAFLVGIVFFCGSLYLLAISGSHWLGMVAPFGGMAFLVGWVMLAMGVLRDD